MKFKYDVEKEKMIIQESSTIEYRQIQTWMNRHVKGYRFNPKFKMGVWNGKIDHFHTGSINMGLWKECLKACDMIGSKFEVINKEDFPLNRNVTFEKVNKFCKVFFKDHKVKDKTGKLIPFFPYDYQIETAFKILKNRYCIASVATSGGKTLINSIVFFYNLLEDPDRKILLILPSLTLVTQFYDDINDFNKGLDGKNDNMIDLRIQEIMSDRPRKHSGQGDPNLYISTYQSLAKTEVWGKEFFQQFYTVAVDETHKVTAVSFQKILKETIGHAYYRFGMTGTLPGDDTCEILSIQSLLGPIVNEVKAVDLQKDKKITPMKIKSIYLNHADEEFNSQLAMIRRNPNNGSKAYQTERKYVQESEKRLEFICKLVEKTKDNTLVLFNIIEYGQKILATLKERYEDLEFLYIDGSVKKDDREEIKRLLELDDGKRRILIASYGTLSTGVSIKNISNIIFTESFKSESLIIQSIGRGLRLHKNKSVCIIYDLIDHFTDKFPKNAFFKHGKARQEMYDKHQYPFTKSNFIL
jgi:superfamily II DNA or RNA helicase